MAEIIAFVLYFVAVLGIGIFFFLKSKSGGEKEYFLGGRAMGPWVTAMSAQASDMSAWLLMGLPGSILAFGLGQAWIGIGLAIGTALNWIFIAKRLRKFSRASGDAITLPQYLSNRFATSSPILKIVCAVIFLISFTIYVASGFSAGATVFTQLFPTLKVEVALIIFAVVILLYTFLGGYKAVCWTDFFQGILMLVAILAVPIVIVAFKNTDPTALTTAFTYVENGKETVCNFTTNLFSASWQEIASGLAWGLGYFGMPHILVRFMGIEKPSMVKKSATVAIIWVVLSLVAAIFIAYLGRMVVGEQLIPDRVQVAEDEYIVYEAESMLPEGATIKLEKSDKIPDGVKNPVKLADGSIVDINTTLPENYTDDNGNAVEVTLKDGPKFVAGGQQKLVFIDLARMLFPGFIAGILLAAIIAASMSTADSQLLVASSSFTSDIYKPLIRKNASEKETLWVGRIVVIIVAFIAYFIASSEGTGAQAIMTMVDNAWGLFGGAFGPVVILSLFWKRLTYEGAVAGIVTGAIVDIVWLVWLTAPTGIYEILPAFIAGLIVTVVVSLIAKAPSQEVLNIYARATDNSIDD